MTKYAIRRIEPLSAFKYGFSLGALTMLPTALLVALVARWLVGLVRAWMDSWGTLETGLLDIDLINLVELTGFLETVRGLDDMGFLLVLAIILIMVVFGGIFIGLQCMLVASTYNLGATGSGGIIVHAEILNPPASASGRVGEELPPLSPQGISQETRDWRDSGLQQGGQGHAPIPSKLRQAGHDQWTSGQQGVSAGHDQAANPPLAPSPPRTIAPRPLPSPPRPFAQQPQAKACLVSSHDGRRYPMMPDKTLIGSAPNNDIVVYGLAPHHAEIRLQDQRYILYDRGSEQISVNERAIMGPNMLKDGFRVRLGQVDFVFKEEV